MTQKKLFSRRTFLRGVGAVTVALPALELTHGAGRAQTTDAPLLFLVHEHGGTVSARNRGGSNNDGNGGHHGMDWWRPTATDRVLHAENLSRLHRGLLDPFVAKMSILAGIDNMAAVAQGPYGGGGHNWVNVTHLTCCDVNTSGEDLRATAPSFDRLIADATSADVPFPSVDLRIHGHNYGTPFKQADGSSVSSSADPRDAFARIFAGVSPDGGPDPELVALQARRKSVLDGVQESFAMLRRRAGQADRDTLDAHAEHIRSMERRLDALGTPSAACTLPDLDAHPDAETTGPLHVDLMVHAARCGLSRVFNLQIGDLLTPWLGTFYATERGHSLGHAGREVGPAGPNASRRADWEAEMETNRRWRIGVLAQLLEKLEATPVGDGTLLDNSLVVYSSEFSNAATHSARDLPILVAGSAGGRFEQGQFIDYNTESGTAYATRASTHNLWTSVLNAFGVPVDHFGNGDAYVEGPLEGFVPSV